MSLTDFQKKTVSHAYNCLRGKNNARFLVADEVGLGKTLVAREIIRKFLEDSEKSDFTVVYICNNQLLAKKNLNKLAPADTNWDIKTPNVNRLSLFPLEKHRLENDKSKDKTQKICYFYALTPGTSFNLTCGNGTVRERRFLYRLAGGTAEYSPSDNSEDAVLCKYRQGVDGWKYYSFDDRTAGCIREKLLAENQFSELTNPASLEPDFPKLRRLLSHYGASLLKPDLVIFDEFQNYEKIFIPNGDNSKNAEKPISAEEEQERDFRQEIDIINSVFAKLDPAPEYLLLSATPFAAFTTQEELARGEVDLSSCDAFCRLVDWLNSGGNFKSQWEKYAEEFKNYCEELKKHNDPDPKQISKARERIQEYISQVMSRTERPADLLEKLISKIDLKTSVLKEPLKIRKTELFSGENDLAEYEKYAFKPLSFMGENYVTFNRYKNSNPAEIFLEKIDDAMKSPYMQKLNEIMSDSKGNLRPLFWLPPTVPSIDLQGAFKDAADAGYSKVLIFSQYRFIPRMISTVFSAKFERDHIKTDSPTQSYKFLREGELVPAVKPLLSPDFEENTAIEEIFSSPAKSVYWAFRKLFQNADENLNQQCRFWSVLIAVALLRYMYHNMAYVKAVVNSDESSENKAAIYCRMGCFGDAAYEYMYLLAQEQGNADDMTKINAVGKQFFRVLQLRTNNLNIYFKEPSAETEIKQHAKKMNTHFADCFSEKERNTDVSSSAEENNEKSDNKLETFVTIVNEILNSRIEQKTLLELLPKESPDRNKELQSAFNSPFKPFVLSTTSIGQEGLDFHWYCRKIMHWNLPSNPVDFDQREGRINRYGSFALRQTLAAEYQKKDSSFTWEKFWYDWSKCSGEKAGGLVPYWLPPKDVCSGNDDNSRKIERIVPFYPLSREHLFINDLLKMQALYRMVIGHPHQDELLSLLRSLSKEDQQKIMACTISLQPSEKNNSIL